MHHVTVRGDGQGMYFNTKRATRGLGGPGVVLGDGQMVA